MTGEGKVEFLDTEFACDTTGFKTGDEVLATIRFEKVDLFDDDKETDLTGHVDFILYMGDHYHLTIKTETGENIWADTNDIWDKGDFVGIKILPEDIHLSKPVKGNE